MQTKCDMTLVSLLPQNCTTEDCPVICDSSGYCKNANAGIKERLDAIEYHSDWKKDHILKIQRKYLTNRLEKMAASLRNIHQM